MFLAEATRDPSAIEQISKMIERYNQLILDINSIEELQNKKDDEIQQLKTIAETELSGLKSQISEIKLKIELATKYKTIVGREFKKVIKTDSFNRLSKRIDNLNFEQRLARSEFYHLLER